MLQRTRFIATWAATAAGVCLFVLFFNALIDPYLVTHAPVIQRVNALKSESNVNARALKAINVMRLKPRRIILGNSRADIGLDPKHPALSDAYNLAMPAGDMNEYLSFFRHALVNQPELQTVVLAIDLIAFAAWQPPMGGRGELDDVLETSNPWAPTMKLLFSADTFFGSVRTLAKNGVGAHVREEYRNDGMLIRHNPLHMSMLQVFETHLRGVYLEGWYRNYRLDEARLTALREIVETCRARGIDLKVLISPAHASLFEAMRVRGLWPTFEEWKRRVVQITPVWDFSGYNGITTEPIRDGMRNYLESSHYAKAVGDLVLDRIFDVGRETWPAGFGTLVTPENVESHLANVREQREAWARGGGQVEVELVEAWARGS